MVGFWERVSETAELFCNGKITQRDYCRINREILDEFLARHDDYADRLAVHYSSIAEYLLDSIYDDPEMFKDTDRIEMLIDAARKEIEVFRKNGYEPWFERMLERALELRKEL